MTESNKLQLHLCKKSIEKFNNIILKYELYKYIKNFICNFYNVLEFDKYNYIGSIVSKYIKKLKNRFMN